MVRPGASGKATSLCVNVLRDAARAVVETCKLHMGLMLEVEANPGDPRRPDVRYGSSIALAAEAGGGWNLAVVGDRQSCDKLTRILFALEKDEQPAREDLADGLGALASVAARVLTASRLAAGQKVQPGLPLFIEGRGCADLFAPGQQGFSQSLNGPDGITVHVIITWQDDAQ